ncbi:hypothetical protein Ciccas_002858 [Cichlidogyrus casuarinus]|uniref:Uncharacterized protein n=1 Tax=Cichlidogyrus casuarinus TaxID=1844966 RepID=A0ABD2QG20_9PLAT
MTNQEPLNMDNLELLLSISKRFFKALFGLHAKPLSSIISPQLVTIIRISNGILQSPGAKEKLSEKNRCKGFTEEPLVSLFNPYIRRWHLDFRSSMKQLLSEQYLVSEGVWDDFCERLVASPSHQKYIFASCRLVEMRKLLQLYEKNLVTPQNYLQPTLTSDLIKSLPLLQDGYVTVTPNYSDLDQSFMNIFGLLLSVETAAQEPCKSSCTCCIVYQKNLRFCLKTMDNGPLFLKKWTRSKEILSNLLLDCDQKISKSLLEFLNSDSMIMEFDNVIGSSTPRHSTSKDDLLLDFKTASQNFSVVEKMRLLQSVICDSLHASSACGKEFWQIQTKFLEKFNDALASAILKGKERSKALNREIHNALASSENSLKSKDLNRRDSTSRGPRSSLINIVKGGSSKQKSSTLLVGAVQRTGSIKVSSPLADKLRNRMATIRK